MTDVEWRGRVENLLTDGERVVAREPVGEGQVVVTDRRVLALTTGGRGPNYRAVDRPNVDGVGVDRVSTGRLRWPVVFLVAGGAFGALGATIDLADAVPRPDLPAGADFGVSDAIEAIRSVLALVDDAALALGGLLGLVGLVLVVRWLRSRERVLVLSVAGDEDVHLPLPPGAAEGTTPSGPDPLVPADEAPPAEDPGVVERVRRAIAEA